MALLKRAFLERGPDLFGDDNTAQQYERRLVELEQLLGKKELEIALPSNF